ncbi:MAG TPA: Lrp/AsnC ligand binding domain-containing protein [Nitrosopumilaceae archaeon]|nr:Lrp/AsnC ligand binding domain-containing protein [Nitrosopumilaceae archaeon]HXV39117.1 Lrp/AsnC ligand binding domain-containing protein [Nitrosopumilaceae archaeon]
MAQAYVIIHCKTGMEEWVIRNLKKIEGVKEAVGVFSLYDIVVKVEAKDQSMLEKIIKQIRKVEHIHTTMTLTVIEEQEK